MKKITIFSIFLLILSFSAILFPEQTYAKIDNYTISINCQVQNFSSNEYTFNANKFVADYSIIKEDGFISFTASAINNIEGEQKDVIEYQWLNSERKVISDNQNLKLYKSLSQLDLDRQIIKTNFTNKQTSRESIYVLVVVNKTKNQKDEIPVTVSITDTNNELKMQTLSSDIPEKVYSHSEDIDFYAIMPTVATNEISWFVKQPGSTSYELKATGNMFTFSPTKMIDPNVADGEYKIVALCKTTSKTYYSKVHTINASTLTFENPGLGAISILNAKVQNSRAKIEAFRYSLSNTENMNYSNIYWYVNGVRVASGASFVYEPITTEKYKVTVKYNDPIKGLSDILDSHDETPENTDTYILILAVIGAVIVLSGILAASIIVTNKKRDVVW